MESTATCVDPDAMLDFVEGRASPELRAAVEKHASACTACREVLSSLARERAATAAGDTPTRLLRPVRGSNVDRLSPDDTIARYIVRGLLGAGGMGAVYVAYDPELGRKVAIKLLAPALGDSDVRATFEARFRREARALAQVTHPNVVAVYDVGRVDDRMFIAMELIEGETLAHWCRSERRTPGAILERFVAAGHGLAAAHAAGIVHRDVKPENIMIGNDGRVRVVDFGLARAELGDVRLTLAGAVMGTPQYMAPEQHRGEEADARTDQFSFCVALYIALFGQVPFGGSDRVSIARAVMAGEPREPPRGRGVPRRIWHALRRGMSTARDDRFATLEELLAQIAPGRSTRRVAVVAAIGLGLAIAGAITAVEIATPPSGARVAPADARSDAAAPPADAARPAGDASQASAPPDAAPMDAPSPVKVPTARHRGHPHKKGHVEDLPADRAD